VHIFLQARSTSKRLPGKTLMELKPGVTILDFILDQITAAVPCGVVTVVLCPYGDTPITDFCRGRGVAFFEGEEENVLERFRAAMETYKPDSIVRLTADCPFIGLVNLAGMIAIYNKNNTDFLTNVFGFPDGNDIEIFSVRALKWAVKNARDARDREHVTITIKEQMEKFNRQGYRGMTVQSVYNINWFPKMSIDTEKDYMWAKSHIEYLDQNLELNRKLLTGR
jgi:spore coat polysaccharide biosynthesis protein SpsF